MKYLNRLALVAVMGAVVQAANAQASFSVVAAYYTLDTAGPFNFTVNTNSPAMTIDFLPGAPAFKVGDSTPYGSGVGTIIYNVTSQLPINGIDLLIQGDVQQWGELNWSETAEFGNINLGSISGTRRGSSWAGGSDGSFTQLAHLTFSQPVFSFKVKKTFDIDIAANMPPSQSVATVGLIEQNMTPVPEPSMMIGLGIGLSALLAKRRKK